MQDQFPNLEPKPVGAYVRNVHPCGHSDEEGVVIQAEEWPERTGGTITVATGIGGTTYGPAHNWRPIATKPAWLARALELEHPRAVSLLAAVEKIQDEALAAVIGATAIDVDAAELVLAWPAARRHACSRGGRHEARYYLIGTVLEQKHETARRRARRALEAA